MRPGRAWISAPTSFSYEPHNLGVGDSTNHVCLLANHGDQPRYNVTAVAHNPGTIAANVTATFVGLASNGARPAKTVRIEPNRSATLSGSPPDFNSPTYVGVIRLESSQPIIPGGEVELYHFGTRDILIGPHAIAPVVWFELTPARVEQPPAGPAAGRGTATPAPARPGP